MTLGALYFIYQGYNTDDPDALKFYVITAVIPTVAFASYLSMVSGVFCYDNRDSR